MKVTVHAYIGLICNHVAYQASVSLVNPSYNALSICATLYNIPLKGYTPAQPAHVVLYLRFCCVPYLDISGTQSMLQHSDYSINGCVQLAFSLPIISRSTSNIALRELTDIHVGPCYSTEEFHKLFTVSHVKSASSLPKCPYAAVF